MSNLQEQLTRFSNCKTVRDALDKIYRNGMNNSWDHSSHAAAAEAIKIMCDRGEFNDVGGSDVDAELIDRLNKLEDELSKQKNDNIILKQQLARVKSANAVNEVKNVPYPEEKPKVVRRAPAKK